MAMQVRQGMIRQGIRQGVRESMRGVVGSRGYSYTTGAIVMNGTTSYATLGLPAALTAVLRPGVEWSIEFMHKRAATGTVGALVCKGAGAGARTLYLQSPGGTGVTGEVGGTTTVNNQGNVNRTATWRHYVFRNHFTAGVYKSSVVIDGLNTISTEATSGATEDTTKDILIGARRNASNADAINFMAGSFSELRFWSKSLSNNEILQLWARPGAIDIGLTGLVAYFPLRSNVVDTIAAITGTAVSSTYDTVDAPRQPIVGWGDSLTDGTGSAYTGMEKTYLRRAPLCNYRDNISQGVGGEGSTQIGVRFAAQPYTRQAIQIIWAGRNGVLTDTGTILTDIRAMVAALSHDRYLVLSITNKRDGTEDIGSANYIQIAAVNAQLSAAFGSHYYDVRAWLIANATPPGDNADVAADRIPASLAYTDNLHLNDTGYDVVATGVNTKIASMGWTN